MSNIETLAFNIEILGIGRRATARNANTYDTKVREKTSETECSLRHPIDDRTSQPDSVFLIPSTKIRTSLNTHDLYVYYTEQRNTSTIQASYSIKRNPLFTRIGSDRKEVSFPFLRPEIAQSDEMQCILRRCRTQGCRNFASTIVRGHVFIYVCPLSAMRVGFVPKLDPPLYYRIFCAFWEKGPFRREKREREKEGRIKRGRWGQWT